MATWIGNVPVAGCDVMITLTCSTNSSICSPPASREKSAAILDGKNCTEAVFLKFTLTEQCFALIVEQISANLHHFVLRADGLWNFYGTRYKVAGPPELLQRSHCHELSSALLLGPATWSVSRKSSRDHNKIFKM